MAWDDGDDFPGYVSAAERRRRARRALDALRARGEEPRPVVVEGRELAHTFWGKAWCDALEGHADLATRLPRGRAYVRNGSVLDLRLAPGEVRALVSGTDVYEVRVGIRPLPAARWKAVRAACAGRIGTVVELLAGKLSSGVMAVLCDPATGLFPETAELELSCTCPDGAWLCKHLAAVLYAVGARLDTEPELLFGLRGVELEELVADASAAPARGARPGGSALAGEDLGALFGIELESGPVEQEGKARRKKAAGRKKAGKRKGQRRREPRKARR